MVGIQLQVRFYGQTMSLVVAIVWSLVLVSVIAFKIAGCSCVGLRVTADEEAEGLDWAPSTASVVTDL